MGGYIAAICDDDPNTSTVEYKLQAYLIYDLGGVQYPNAVNLQEAQGQTFQLTQASATTIQLGTYNADVVLYESTVALNANTMYDIGYSTCCRSGAFVNLGNAMSSTMYFNTVFFTGAGCNSTPAMLAPLALNWPQNVPWFTSFAAVDLDWDFLFYDFDTIQTAPGMSLAYDTTAYDTIGRPALDSLAGVFTMLAPNTGFYGFGFVIYALDASGQLTSATRVDFPIGVVPPPASAGGGNFIQIGVPSTVLNSVATFNVSNPDTLYMGAYSDSSVSAHVFYPASVDSNEVYVDIQSLKQAGSATVEFSWAPTTAGGVSEFPVVVRYESEGWEKDYVFIARKNNDVGVGEFEETSLTLYPNPSEGAFTLEFEEGANEMKVHDLQGRLVASTSIDPNSTVVTSQLELESGIYFVSVEFENGSVAVQALIVE